MFWKSFGEACGIARVFASISLRRLVPPTPGQQSPPRCSSSRSLQRRLHHWEAANVVKPMVAVQRNSNASLIFSSSEIRPAALRFHPPPRIIVANRHRDTSCTATRPPPPRELHCDTTSTATRPPPPSSSRKERYGEARTKQALRERRGRTQIAAGPGYVN